MKATELRALMDTYHVRPSKALGQNFLIDDATCARIVAAAKVQPHDTVVEIGPGFGALTKHLLATGARVIAIERDRHLAAFLQDTYGTAPNFTLHTHDALRFPIALQVPQPYILVGNLPYSITSPLIERFLEEGPRPTRAICMVQKEVADRILAHPPEMNQLAITVQLLGHAHRLFMVAPHAFIPQPDVDSTVIHIAIEPRVSSEIFCRTQYIAHIAFAHKRKQLFSTLSKAHIATSEHLTAAFAHAGVLPSARPETLQVEQWIDLVVYLSQF